MAKEHLIKIFLSASIPYLDANKDEIYYDTADVIAIRDAVRALSTVVIPETHLVWGGHPAITPLIREVMDKMQYNYNSHVTIYQSNFFKDQFIPDNDYFDHLVIVDKVEKDLELSVKKKRIQMFSDHDFTAGIFIGGMNGIIDEYKMFREFHPDALTYPIASTGAAAKLVYDEFGFEDHRLEKNYTYMSLFKEILAEIKGELPVL